VHGFGYGQPEHREDDRIGRFRHKPCSKSGKHFGQDFSVAQFGEIGRCFQPLGALGDAGDEHRFLVAEQRVKFAFRNARARRNLQRAGLRIAGLHERRKGRAEDPRPDLGPAGVLLARLHLSTYRLIFPLDLVPIGTIFRFIRYRIVPKRTPKGKSVMTKPILVTSAAGGTQGRTGRHVSEMLLERGARVRAFVRQLDERSDRLKSLGAEILVGDFLDVRSVEQAARGVSAVYFAYPVQDGLGDATAAMAFAARKHGVSRLVNLVMYQSSTDAPTPRMRQNYLSEQVFEWAGIGAVHIRATVFYENLGSLARASLPAQGAVRLPWGKEQTVLPLVAGEDVARVALGLLTSPSLMPGTAYPVIGSVISLKDIIATFGRVLGKSVRYEEISDEQWRSEALARGLNAHALEHLSSLWKALRAAGLDPERARFAVTDTIEKLGGAKPKTFEAFVREGQSGLMAKSA